MELPCSSHHSERCCARLASPPRIAASSLTGPEASLATITASSGSGVARKRTWLGARGSRVQIPPPRPSPREVEHHPQRPGQARRIDRLDHRPDVAAVAVRDAPDEAPELPVHRAALPGLLLREGLPWLRVTLQGDQSEEQVFAGRPDQLILEIDDAGEETESLELSAIADGTVARPGSLQRPPDHVLFALVVKSGDPGFRLLDGQLPQVTEHGVGAVGGNDRDAFGGEVAPRAAGGQGQRELVGDALDQDYRLMRRRDRTGARRSPPPRSKARPGSRLPWRRSGRPGCR